MRTSRRSRAISVLELAVAVVVIGVLGAVIIPAFASQKESVHDVVAQSSLETVASVAHAHLVRERIHSLTTSAALAALIAEEDPVLNVSPDPSESPHEVTVAMTSEDSYVLSALSATGLCWNIHTDLSGAQTLTSNPYTPCIAEAAVTPPADPTPTSEPVDFGEFSMFALGSPSCSPTLTVHTSSLLVEGAMHSNGDIELTSSSGEIYGYVSYVSGITAWHGGEYLGGAGQEDPIEDAPPWALPDYAPGSEKAGVAGADYHHWPSGMDEAVTNVEAGLHYVDGDAKLSPAGGPSQSLDGVTIVATGTIEVSTGADFTITPWDPDGVTLYADSGGSPDCATEGIRVQGSTMHFSGTLFSPNGSVEVHTSTAESTDGQIVAYRTQVTGSHLGMTNS